MADKIFNKRSYTPGSKPTTSNLEALGEIAINVNDGKAFLRKSGSGIDTIEEFITTNAVNTGSITISGSLNLTGSFLVTGSTTQTGNNTLIGNTVLSGSITISGSLGSTIPSVQIYGDIRQAGYHRFDPVLTNIDTSISASYIYVSGSTNDLYFSQNSAGYNNVTRLRWLEGNLYTGLLHGGLITTQSSTVYQISSGSGIIVNLNASIGIDPYPVVQFLSWPNLSASIAPLTASYQQAFVSIDSTGNIYQQGTPYAAGQYDTEINIGIVLFQNGSTINGVKTQPSLAYGFEQQQNIFNRAFGPLKLSGYTLAPSASSVGSLIVAGGTAYSPGSNYPVDPNNPSYAVDSGTNVSKIFRYRQSGSTWVYDTNGGAGYTAIDPTQYSNNGVLTAVPGNGANRQWSIQRVFWFPNSVAKAIVVYYGNATYTTQTDATSNIPYEPFVEAPNTAANAIYLGSIVVRNNADFTVNDSYNIQPGGLFRQVGGSGGGGSVITQTLSGLSDVLISGPTSGQALVYDTTAAKWENKSFISASISGNASFATSASYASGSTSASFASFATSASYASGSTSASFASFATSASYASGSTSASYTLFATSASYASGSTSASFAATASSADNFLIRSGATFSGSINHSGSFTTNGTITATTLVVTTITASTEFLTGSTKFGDATIDSHQFTGSVGISGSLTVVGPTVASGSFTGSFLGTHTGSFTGSYTGSFTGSLLGTASWAQSSSVALNSILFNSTASSVFATTGSNRFNGNQTITGSVIMSGSVNPELIVIGDQIITGSFRVTGSTSLTGSLGVLGAVSASSFTGSYTGSLSGSLFGTASWSTSASNAVTAAFITTAQTASYVLQAVSASFASNATLLDGIDSTVFATTGSNTFRGDQLISGSLRVTGSATLTGSLNILGAVSASSFTGSMTGSLTGSLFGTASWAQSASVALTASFITSSNVRGPFGVNSILSASYASGSTSSSYAISSSYALSASYAQSSSYALTASVVTNAFIQGGNSFGAAALLGTNDAQNLQFETNGTVRMTINSIGNVGIGVSPTTRLHISGANGEILRIQASGVGNNYIGFNSGSTSLGYIGYGSAVVNSLSLVNYMNAATNIGTNSAVVMTITGSSVGIGTTTPNAKVTIDNVLANGNGVALDVTGSGDVKLTDGGSIFFGEYSYAGSTYIRGFDAADSLEIVSNGTSAAIFKSTGVGIGRSPLAKLHVSGTTGGVFEVDGAGDAGANALYVSASGNVGIGIATPSYKLTVATSAFPAVGIFRDVDVVSVGPAGQSIEIGARSGSNFIPAASIIGGLDNPGLTGNLTFQTRTANTLTTKMFISASGDVGIATVTPYEKLEVAGAISATGTSTNNGTQGHATTLSVNSGTSYLQAVDWGAEFKPLVIDGKTINLQTGVGSTTSRITIDVTGSVGIGVTAPTSKLDVNGIIVAGNTTATNGSIILQDQYSLGHVSNFGTNASSGGPVVGYCVYPSSSITNTFASSVTNALNISRAAFSVDSEFRWYTGGSQTLNIGAQATLTQKMALTNAGNLGIGISSPAYRLDVSGSARISGSLSVGNILPSATVGRIDASNDVVAFSTSDIRFKTNVTPISDALDKITQIGGYEFDWIPNQEHHGFEGHDVGVIAQEIEKVLPEVVKERDSGYKAVKYEKIVPLLIEAIKEQQKQIDELKYLLQNKI
jgi:hypothetical protein